MKRFVFVCVVMLTATAAADPPMVVKTEPANGEQDVDPNLRQITIEFDQDMDMGGFSACGGGENFPEIVGRPRFAGKRKFVMRVRLKPEHDYEFSVNCPAASNFVSATGEPVRMHPVSFRTGAPGNDQAQEPDQEPAVDDNAAAVAVLRESIDNWYSYRDRLGLDWDALFEQYTPMLRDAKTSQRFAAVAGAMLANTKDKHIWLVVDGEIVPAYVNPITPNANFDLLPKLVPNWRPFGESVYAGAFEDGITYLRIDSWSGDMPTREFMMLFDFLARSHDAPGMVIDVRANGGGDDRLAMVFAGCFFDEPVLFGRTVWRNPSAEGGFNPPADRVVRPFVQNPETRYDGPVALLIGPVVMSSAENFVMMMKQCPQVTTFGSKTQGSSGNPQPYDLGNGVTVVLPIWKEMLPDGTEIEGVGIEPDIKVDAAPGDIDDADPVLDAALEHLRRR